MSDGTPTPEDRRTSTRRGLHRDAVEAVGMRIVSGELAVGATLPNETDLGEDLAVSRTVVREAVKVLAAKGLVVTRPRTGSRVEPRAKWDLIDHDVLDWIIATGPSHDFYADLFEVRAIFEPQAAELAALRRTDTEMRRIEDLLARMEAAGDDHGAYIEADLHLHAAILGASHNELLTRLSSTLAVALQAGRRVTTRIAAGPSSSIPLHRDVVHAIARGRPQAARRAMAALIRYATRDMEVVLAEEARP